MMMIVQKRRMIHLWIAMLEKRKENKIENIQGKLAISIIHNNNSYNDNNNCCNYNVFIYLYIDQLHRVVLIMLRIISNKLLHYP